jgi:hypothetical protein
VARTRAGARTPVASRALPASVRGVGARTPSTPSAGRADLVDEIVAVVRLQLTEGETEVHARAVKGSGCARCAVRTVTPVTIPNPASDSFARLSVGASTTGGGGPLAGRLRFSTASRTSSARAFSSQMVSFGTDQGLSGGAVGLLVAAFGGCLLLGSFLSPLVRRVLPVRAVLVLELWTWLGCAFFIVWPNVYVLAAGILPTALAIPSTDSVVRGYGIAMSADRLLGRAESARSTMALLIAPLGPLVAGLLLANISARATIAVFAAFALTLALWGTFSPSIRAAPTLDELDRSGRRGVAALR